MAPSNVEAWLMAPSASTVPVLRLPSVRVSVPVTVSVVPAPTVYVVLPPANVTSLRVWVPVIAWLPAKTTNDVPGSSVPAVYVQPVVVRIVPASVSVPEGLLMTTLGRLPAASVAAPVNVWAPAPSMSSVPVLPSNVEAWLMAPCASTVPVLRLPSVRVNVPPTVKVVPAATV